MAKMADSQIAKRYDEQASTGAIGDRNYGEGSLCEEHAANGAASPADWRSLPLSAASTR